VSATSRMFAVMLVMLFAVLGIGFLASWDRTHAAFPLTPNDVRLVSIQTAERLAQARLHNDLAETAGEWQRGIEGISFLLCGSLCFLGIRLRNQAIRNTRSYESVEHALERRVEERTRELRQEVEDRRLAEHLNRGQRKILEMLTDLEGYATEDILRYLTQTVAARNQGWECALHMAEVRGDGLCLAASSDVNDRLKEYLEYVGAEFRDTPECQASASGELHIVEQLSEVGLPWSSLLVANGIFSVWSMPFWRDSGSRLAGILTIYARSRCRPSVREQELLEGAAKLASLVVEHRRIHSEVEHNSLQDALTGLPNRKAAEDALSKAIRTANRQGECVAVLWVDIHRFKHINDQHGHNTGDYVLKTVAERLRRSPLSTSLVARVGEDEFMVLVPGTADSIDTVEIARRIGGSISRPVYAGSNKLSVSANIGVCVYPQDGNTADLLERNAEYAASRAKRAGEPFCAFSPAMSKEAREAIEIEDALGVALERNQLRLVYQPLYSLAGELTGFEALLRFRHPRLGNVSPARFIPIAEETRLILPIGDWCLREACRQLQAWQQAGTPSVRMSVNISALQFMRDDFADTVARVISEFGLTPQQLVLELTESVVMEDYDAVVRQMNLLRQCGVHIAMDDFGTGYSSLSYIHRIPVDILKIDRSFVERITDPEGTRPIIEAVISMAMHLGLSVIAEGVETCEQHNILKEAGCHGFQGYLFAKPLPPEEAEACLIASRTTRFGGHLAKTGDSLAVA